MVVRRGKCETKALDEPRRMEKRRVDHDLDEETDEAEVVTGFFACYLLCSLSPSHKSHTYIGFTVNPRRRIKQHNGEKRCGAWRTKRGRPWEMVLCIYGFPSNISALQFEWAWQHPTESLAVRKAASSFKSLSGLANKIKLAYTMLTLPSWENLNLTVNFLSSKYAKHIAGCPKLPNQMKFSISAMDELPCYAELALHASIDDFEEEREEQGEVVNQMGYITSNNLSPNSTEEYYENLFDSSRKLLRLSEFNEDHWQSPKRAVELRSASSPGYCSEDCGIERARQKSLPRRSDNNEALTDLLKSPIVDVINLCTPTSGNFRSKTKRALFDSTIIDLTDSPMVIQL